MNDIQNLKPYYIPRFLKLKDLLQQKSYFLFGPRQTGKTKFIELELAPYKTYNLLHSDTYRRLAHSPELLRQEATPEDDIIIIDEIQRLPTLLNEVHALIEEKRIRFLLTGSNARKLRQTSGTNLLGGRARSRILHPFVFAELPEFNVHKIINYGTLPSIWFETDPDEDLSAYIGQYLQLEIAAEGLVRNIPTFSRFLEVAALCNGKLINFTNLANDAQVPRTTVYEYFSILKDTLIAYEVPAWKKSKKRKPISTSKFYFFDVGVLRHLQGRNLLTEGTPEFGEAFESYIFHELKAYIDYCNPKLTLHHWRSDSHFEVDFIMGDTTAIEVKAKKNVTDHDLKGIYALQEEKNLKNYFVVSLEKQFRQVGTIQIVPIALFLKKLWGKEIEF